MDKKKVILLIAYNPPIFRLIQIKILILKLKLYQALKKMKMMNIFMKQLMINSI